MSSIPEELYEYALLTCDYGEQFNRNHKFIKAFDSLAEAKNHAENTLNLKLENENYEFEIRKQISESKLMCVYAEALKYRDLIK